MRPPTWQLDAARATLAGDALEGRLDLTAPAEGLGGLRLGGAGWTEAGLLGLDWQAPLPIGPDVLTERFARAADLVAAYEETRDHPVRVDAVWRARGPASGDGLLAALDLTVSVRTSRPDARPALVVRSRAAACEMLRLTDAEAGLFEHVAISPPCAVPLSSSGGASCVVLRVSGKRPSYVEMVHPLDCPDDEIRCAAEGAPVELSHRLFARPLEKGVILRSRVRGLWVACEGDVSVAAESYRRFAASEPPLGA
jgi:hypothetical protein